MREGSGGFSLIEIVIALGVVAFALVAILGLFPVAMTAAKDSRSETRAASIAQLIFSQLRTQPADRVSLPLGPDPTRSSSTDGNLAINLENDSTIYVLFSEEGIPLRRASASHFNNGSLPIPTAAFQVRIAVDANQPFNGLSHIRVDVSHPANVPLDVRQTNSFVGYFNNRAP